FAGLVIVAIAGNAVENATGLVLAWKRQSDLAISVVKNSVAQIAAFLYPVLVLISLTFAHTLTFALAPVYVGALALRVVSHARPDLDVRLWQRALHRLGVAERHERVALAPQRCDRPVEVQAP